MGVNAITIDRTNNYIYYTSGSLSIYRKKLDPLGSEEVFDIGLELSNFGTNGICSDQNGLLFVANIYGPEVVKYDPSKPQGSRIIGTYTYSDLSFDIWDVLVKGNYLYVTDSVSSGTNSPLVRFEINNPATYITYGTFGTTTGDFYGPHVFAAILNKKLYITDDDGLFNIKLTALDDITGAKLADIW